MYLLSDTRRTLLSSAHPQVELLRHKVAHKRGLQWDVAYRAQLRQRGTQDFCVAVSAHSRLSVPLRLAQTEYPGPQLQSQTKMHTC